MAIVHVLEQLILFFILLSISPMESSLSDSESLLKLKNSLANTTALHNWGPDSAACDTANTWAGINCENGFVTVLRLEDMGLSGQFDVDALLEMKGLRVISLQNNAFSGPIPEFNRLGALKAIFLSRNKFSGEIPSDYFENMNSLKKVWLGGNDFTGPIPPSLTRVPSLMELHLENNKFSGKIPPLEQTGLGSLDLSNNNLEGEIPPTLSKFQENSFLGNPGLCGAKLGACNSTGTVPTPVAEPTTSPPEAGPKAESESNKANSEILAAWTMAGCMLILTVMIIAIVVMRRRQKKSAVVQEGDGEDSLHLRVSSAASEKDIVINSPTQTGLDSGRSNRRGGGGGGGGGANGKDLVMVNYDKGAFGLADLLKANAELLGNGALGSSYKTMMSSGVTLVVKRLKHTNKMERDGFDAVIRRFGRLQHPNVLAPLAYHFQKEEKLLVQEYIPRGSLLYLLHGDRGPNHAELNWSAQVKIVQGIAQGLSYLRTELASFDLPHGNLKSSNVLLGSNFEPLLVDYGFSPLVGKQQAAKSLFAYKSPEAAQIQIVSPECDVYSLGIIILEILTLKFPSQYNANKGGTDVVEWVKSAISEGREGDVLDPLIKSSSFHSLGEMERLLRIGSACTESIPDQRPDLAEVVRMVEEIEIDDHRPKGRTIQLMPTLEHGYADSVLPRSRTLNVEEDHNGQSGRRDDDFVNIVP